MVEPSPASIADWSVSVLLDLAMLGGILRERQVRAGTRFCATEIADLACSVLMHGSFAQPLEAEGTLCYLTGLLIELLRGITWGELIPVAC